MYKRQCGGFQHALIEYGRNVLGYADAHDVQYDPDAATPFIIPLCCSLVGETAPLYLEPGTLLAGVFGDVEASDVTYHCKYGLNPDYQEAIAASALRISAWDAERAPRAVEVVDHPFFVATLVQPELSSTPQDIHPLIRAFCAAATARAAVDTATALR